MVLADATRLIRGGRTTDDGVVLLWDGGPSA